MANHNVTLFVDTSVNLNPQNVDSYTNFGQASGTNENFTTTVNVGDTVTWKGESSTQPTVTVSITKIQYNGGSEVFQASVLDGSGSPATVVGTIESDTGGEEEEYTLSFTVSNQNGTFNIDPKIQVNPQ
jgi:plastocyanin